MEDVLRPRKTEPRAKTNVRFACVWGSELRVCGIKGSRFRETLPSTVNVRGLAFERVGREEAGTQHLRIEFGVCEGRVWGMA